MTGKKKKSRLKNEKLNFLAELGRTNAWLEARYTRFLKPYGISPQQLNILRVLRRENTRIKMNMINELLIVKSPNVTRLVDKLITNDLVLRNRSSEDRRIVYIEITKSGLDLLARFDKDHEGELSEYMDSFTIKEAVETTKLLKRIRK